METDNVSKLPIVFIIGPTASGKTSLAVKLAEKYNGEIICADSRTVYKEMDIGTAKPTRVDQTRVQHWGLDLVEPTERYTAAMFKIYAEQKIHEIRNRGHVPFIVGGSGLYIDSVLYNYSFGGDVDLTLRSKLESMNIDELMIYSYKNNILIDNTVKNKRHIIRKIELGGRTTSKQKVPISTSVIVGITTDKTVLRSRIAKRTEQLFENGVVEEAIMLGKKYGWDIPSMSGNIYPLVRDYLKEVLSLEEIQVRNTTVDWQLAKRQLTWFRRNSDIKWLSLKDAEKFVSDRLATG